MKYWSRSMRISRPFCAKDPGKFVERYDTVEDWLLVKVFETKPSSTKMRRIRKMASREKKVGA